MDEIIDDEYIINKFYGKFGLIGKLFNNISESIKIYLENKYTDSLSFKETVYRIKHNINTTPCCPICGKPLLFTNRNIFQKTCSKQCGYKLAKINSKITCFEKYGDANYNNRKLAKQTCLEKYGVDNPAKHVSIQEKTKQTCLEKYGVEFVTQSNIQKEKSKQTCLEKYGVEYSFQSENNKEKTKQSCLEKYGVEYITQTDLQKEKCKQTCLEKYGDENYRNIECAKQTCLEKYGDENYRNIEKFKKTCLERYGVEFPNQYINIHKKIVNTFLTKEVQYKRLETLKKNHTFNTSKIEIKLKQYFDDNNINYIYQYKSEEYPFVCDFYFPEFNLYVEIQGSWTHGGHPYNEELDQEILNKWVEQSKTSNYYKNAIETWTIRDLRKRQIAKENKLNYIEIFSTNFYICIDIINEYINNIGNSSVEQQ